ncbi:MAG: hypothetical protein KatS3mg029_0573 [Saprospiraceae bacterium]|nr:MAG: hypothetical protein KatS3mg029_0573 [Saprospiraceae bacterium]
MEEVSPLKKVISMKIFWAPSPSAGSAIEPGLPPGKEAGMQRYGHTTCSLAPESVNSPCDRLWAHACSFH